MARLVVHQGSTTDTSIGHGHWGKAGGGRPRGSARSPPGRMSSHPASWATPPTGESKRVASASEREREREGGKRKGERERERERERAEDKERDQHTHTHTGSVGRPRRTSSGRWNLEGPWPPPPL